MHACATYLNCIVNSGRCQLMLLGVSFVFCAVMFVLINIIFLFYYIRNASLFLVNKT